MAGPERGPVAFGFPGVGVRLCGRETDFYRTHLTTMAPYLEEASEHAGVDLGAALEGDRIAGLPDGQQQFFTYAFGVAAAVTFEEMGTVPACTAGYSFGIYAALVCTGALPFADGTRALVRAFELMARSSEGMGYSMGITVGLRDREISELLAEAAPSVHLVNSNNETCHVFSGKSEDLDSLLATATLRDAFSASRLPVEIPYHHPEVLAHASVEFAAYLDTLKWSRPRCPIISSIDQTLVSDVEGLKAMTAANLSTPISWRRVITALDRMGYGALLECGPGISLTQNGRFSPVELEFINLKNHARRDRSGS